MALGTKIQSLRKSLNLTQKELAATIGVTTGTIAEWEADEAAPSLTELSGLSKALNVSSDVLLDATSEEVSVPVTVPREELKPVVVPVQKRKQTNWIIGLAVLCVAIVVMIILWIQGVFTPEPLLFSEDTARIEAADASVVTLFCYDYDGQLAATGSGFIAFNGRTVITNYHVMTSAYTCKISTNQDISYEVDKILCYSKENDIAILQLDMDTGLQPLTFGDSGVIKKGETVVAIGSPLGIKNTVSTGVLSGRLTEDSMHVLQFTAPISSGSSGGALFDSNGNVIGITYASYIDGQNLNLAIPIELASGLYQEASDAIGSVSYICKKEHPYIQYLESHKNIPTVILEDLKQNPEEYDGCVLRMNIFISSCAMNQDNEDVDIYFFVSNMNDVSANFDYDCDRRSRIHFENHPLLECRVSTNDIPIYPIQAGAYITIVGTFSYSPVDTAEHSGPFEDFLYRYRCSDACLFVKYIDVIQ